MQTYDDTTFWNGSKCDLVQKNILIDASLIWLFNTEW